MIGRLLNRLLPWFLSHVPYKEIGWKEIDETFYRFQLIKTRWFGLYLHAVRAPIWHPACHNHPWHFWALLLAGGYWEKYRGKVTWRSAGSLLFRHAKFSHAVRTTENWNWSLVLVSWKIQPWGFHTCADGHSHGQSVTF